MSGLWRQGGAGRMNTMPGRPQAGGFNAAASAAVDPDAGARCRGSEQSLQLLVELVAEAMRMLRAAGKPVDADAFAEQIAAHVHRIEAADRPSVSMPHLEDDQEAAHAVRQL